MSLFGNEKKAIMSQLAEIAKVVNVKKYGAKGDGVTDDTTAIRNAISAAGSEGIVFFPKPSSYYKITDTIILPFMPGLTLLGSGWGNCEIQMAVDDKPIFEATQQDLNSITFKELKLTYTNQQTGVNAYAIAFSNATGNPSGIYYWNIQKVKILKASIGIGVKMESGKLPVWGCSFEDIYFESIGISCIKLTSPTAVGTPFNYFRRIIINQKTTINTGRALELRGEWIIDTLDVEKWTGKILYADSGFNCSLRQVHIEWHNISLNNTKMIELYDGAYHIQGVDASLEPTVNADYYLFSGNSGAKITLEHVKVSNSTVIGTVYLLDGSARTFISHITKSANVLDWYPSLPAWQNCLTYDGMAPIVPTGQSLPTASASFRGQMLRVNGNGTTTADTIYQCLMSATGTYTWKPIITG